MKQIASSAAAVVLVLNAVAAQRESIPPDDAIQQGEWHTY